MTGELDSQRKRLTEEEAKCQTEFECGIQELPNLIEGFKTEAENSLANAEVILGLREGEVPNEAPVEEEAPAPAPTPAPQTQTRTPIRRVKMPQQHKDEDSLI